MEENLWQSIILNFDWLPYTITKNWILQKELNKKMTVFSHNENKVPDLGSFLSTRVVMNADVIAWFKEEQTINGLYKSFGQCSYKTIDRLCLYIDFEHCCIHIENPSCITLLVSISRILSFGLMLLDWSIDP